MERQNARDNTNDVDMNKVVVRHTISVFSIWVYFLFFFFSDLEFWLEREIIASR